MLNSVLFLNEHGRKAEDEDACYPETWEMQRKLLNEYNGYFLFNVIQIFFI